HGSSRDDQRRGDLSRGLGLDRELGVRERAGALGPRARRDMPSAAGTPPLAAGCFAAAFGLYRAAGTDYLPALDEGGVILDYLTPPPSTLADTGALLERIERILNTT